MRSNLLKKSCVYLFSNSCVFHVIHQNDYSWSFLFVFFQSIGFQGPWHSQSCFFFHSCVLRLMCSKEPLLSRIHVFFSPFLCSFEPSKHNIFLSFLCCCQSQGFDKPWFVILYFFFYSYVSKRSKILLLPPSLIVQRWLVQFGYYCSYCWACIASQWPIYIRKKREQGIV